MAAMIFKAHSNIRPPGLPVSQGSQGASHPGLHPSAAIRFPSSHASPLSRCPLPEFLHSESFQTTPMPRYVTCHQATLGSLPQVTPQTESRSTGRPTEHREPFRTTQDVQDVQETFSIIFQHISPAKSHIDEKPAWPVVPGAGSQQIHPASKDQFQLSAKTAGLCCMHT